MTSLKTLLAVAVFTAPPITHAAVINLTNDTIDSNTPDGSLAVINGAALTRSDLNSGSGSFRDLFRLQNSPTEQGYNRVVSGSDTAIPGGFNPVITVGDLGTDSTGLFYVFSVDANESNSTPSYISLDSFAVYTGGTSDPATLPAATRAALNSEPTFTNVWDLDESEDNVVLLDNSIGGAGSGSADLLIFIPVTRFAAASDSDLVYIFAEFGNFSNDFNSEAGHENISALNENIAGTITSPIPEPSSLLLTTIGALGLLSVRRRKQ